jgi:GAF domain-containing protein
MVRWQNVLNPVLQVLVDELGYKAASARQLDIEHGTLAVIGAIGLSEGYLSKGAVEVDKSGLDREALQGKVVDVSDIRFDSRLQYPEAAVREGIGSILAAPLALRDKVIGVLRVYSGEPRIASEMEKHFLHAVGKLTARALTIAQRSEAMRNILHQINSSPDMQSVLTAILRRTVDELNYKGGIIRLLDPTGQHLELVAATGVSQAYLSKGSVNVVRSAMDQKVLQGDAVTIYDVANDPGYQYPQEALKEGIRSVQAMPLVAPDREASGGHKVIGVLRVYSSQPHRFGEDEVSFLQVIADLGALALQNAQLYDELHRRIDSLQPDEDGWHRVV